MAQTSLSEAELAALVERAASANTALLKGDIEGYLALIQHAPDYTLMAPFGGTPTRGFDESPDYRARLARFFQGGQGEIELIEAYASGDLAVLALIEWQRAAVGGLPEQEFSLRVTLVFRRVGAEWQLVHRHADPLAKPISQDQAAAIARG